MKKIVRLISVAAIAMVLSIAFSGVALASQPACTTPETESIKTVTQISCPGMMTETEKVSWETSNEDLLNNSPLDIAILKIKPFPAGEAIGKLDYNPCLNVTDGTSNFIKDMDVDTGSVPNLNVMKSIGYTRRTKGSFHDEEVSMSTVADWFPAENVVLCPFAAAARVGPFAPFPASCEDVKAASSMVVTDVLATRRTEVGMSEAPVDLHYEVDATGSGGAGTLARGSIAAEFSASVEEGSTDWWTGGLCANDWVEFYDLGSGLTHYEKCTADGLWEFHKEMDYESVIRP